MKLFVFTIILITGQLIAARNSDNGLPYGGNIVGKDGKLIRGALLRIDQYAVSKLDPYLTAEQRKEMDEIAPTNLQFDDCIVKGDADCLRRIFKEWSRIDDGIGDSLEGPLARAFGAANKRLKEIEGKILASISADGKVNLPQMNEDIKTLFQGLFS